MVSCSTCCITAPGTDRILSGNPGNVTVSRRLTPPLFYVHNSQLYYYHNMTTIFPMNVHNSTLSSPFPYQMKVGKKQEGIKGGHWRWQGTMLYYERGTGSNGGVFYSCKDPTGGLTGLYMFLQPSVHSSSSRCKQFSRLFIADPQHPRGALCSRFTAGLASMCNVCSARSVRSRSLPV